MLANSKFDALTLGRNGREIAALCEKHSVPCGAPEDLALFLHAIDENKLLAMEFWSIVARATERNPRAATDRNGLLTAIVEAVTAQHLAEFESAGPAQRLLIKRTAGMLAGEDIHGPITPDPFAAARNTAVPDLKAKPEPAPPANPLPQRGRQLRLVLDPEPPPAARDDPDADARHNGPTAEPFAIPLSAYADAEPDRSALPRVLAGVLLLALIGGGWYIVRHVPSLSTRSDNAIREAYASVFGGRKAATTTSTSTTPDQPSQPVAAPQAQTPSVQVPQAEVPQPQTPPAPPTPIQHASTASATPPLPASSPEKDRNTESDVTDDPQVVVPEALMRQNLISSRVPVVPDAAVARGIVVLQAVITTRGTVEHLRAISGNPALRHAAIDAASTWRYRPYLLNGTPVDVSTTISVDFSGND